MKAITLDYLKGLTDALYHTQTDLLGGEIEEEKDFNIFVMFAPNGFKVLMTYVNSYYPAIIDTDCVTPKDAMQVLYIAENEKPTKIIKDIIAEMEMIYNLPLPETVEA